jgi:tRNA(Ile)-lysidine synthase TilS/MesJ
MIRPFKAIPEREAVHYARLHLPDILFPADHGTDTETEIRQTTRQLLDAYTVKHPSAQYALAGFSEELLRCTGTESENKPFRKHGVHQHGN